MRKVAAIAAALPGCTYPATRHLSCCCMYTSALPDRLRLTRPSAESSDTRGVRLDALAKMPLVSSVRPAISMGPIITAYRPHALIPFLTWFLFFRNSNHNLALHMQTLDPYATCSNRLCLLFTDLFLQMVHPRMVSKFKLCP